METIKGYWRKLNHKFSKHQFLLRLITVEPVLFLMAAGMDVAHAAQSPGLYWKICKLHTKGYPEIDCANLRSFEKHRKSTEAKLTLQHHSFEHANFTNNYPTANFAANTKLSKVDSSSEFEQLSRNVTNGQRNHKSAVKHHLRESLNIENVVQASAADWGMYISLASVIPLMIVQPLYGAFSDQHGRKINILLGIAGLIMSSLMFVIELTFVNLSLIMLPITQAFIALSGSHGNIYASCYSYISDRTPDKSLLTKKFMILHVVTDVARIITSYGAGVLLETMFYTKVLVMGMGIVTLAFFYTLICTVQKPPKETQTSRNHKAAGIIPENMNPIKFDLRKMFKGNQKEKKVLEEKHVNGVSKVQNGLTSIEEPVRWSVSLLFVKLIGLLENTVSCFKRKRQGHFRAYLYVTVAAFFLLFVAGIGIHHVLNLFELHTPLAWSASQIAYYKGFTEIVNLVGTVFTVLVLKRLHFHETTILLISISSSIVRFALIGVATNTAMMYVAGVFGMASSLVQPVSKSLVCQFVDADEVGKTYVLFALAVDFAMIVSQTTINQLYKATLYVHPGFIFFFVAGLLCITLVAILWIHIDYKRYRQREGLDENGRVKSKGSVSTSIVSVIA